MEQNMLNISEQSIKKNIGKVIVGYDLFKNFAQISYFGAKAEEPDTVSAVTGTSMFNIPLVLAKRPGVGQWFYGREALRYIEDGGIEVSDLLTKAVRGEEVLVEDDTYDPVALLTLFVKRSLSLLSMCVSTKDINAFMFTVEELTPRMVEVLGRVAAGLDLKCEIITYQTHLESFYHYMIHQPQELWQYEVLALEFNDILRAKRFSTTKNTVPEVVLIETKEFDEFCAVTWEEDELAKKAQMERLDTDFEKIAEELLSGNDITTVYLLGDMFKEDWAKESLKLL